MNGSSRAVAAPAQSVTLRVAEMTDLPQVAATLANAFQDDPIVRWWVRDDAGRPAALLRVFTHLAKEYIPHGHVFLTPDGRVAALWRPPGLHSPTMTVWQQIGLFPLILRNAGVRRMRRIASLIRMTEALHPTEPHCYLFMLGVRQDSQGVGLGSAFLAACLERVDRTGMPAYLENSNPANTLLYERHGFVAREQCRASWDAPPILCMWRPARGSRAAPATTRAERPATAPLWLTVTRDCLRGAAHPGRSPSLGPLMKHPL